MAGPCASESLCERGRPSAPGSLAQAGTLAKLRPEVAIRVRDQLRELTMSSVWWCSWESVSAIAIW